MTENLRGAILMVLAMAAFATEDVFIKIISDALPLGQILILLGIGGGILFSIVLLRIRRPLFPRALWSRPVVLRNLCEMVGTTGFVSAIVLTPLSSASAILQALPLAVTLGAALFLGEDVGWRRWSAIIVGFCGVLLVLRPGLQGFEPASLLAVVGVFGLAGRDLATRRIPATLSSWQVSAWGFLSVIPAGAMLLVWGQQAPAMPDPLNVLLLVLALTSGMVGYYMLVASVRLGQIAVITPFRYSRLLFAMVLGVAVFGERPDALTYMGAAIIVCAGLYTIIREQRLRRSSPAPQAGV
ncbi:DMT family transporter [Roseicitreum antarcticum]|uniref:Permease of the drug/metabolite transporter (DMT) superfamily n=1 Tax=Roseicitreum antarcticum TaxID=564137 RepID=A0A1H3CEC3_9RHOB|nr:DMT family transporter [Roseicitreum antarcticum]SDX51849.1 Permease of the drug/metabolite transporter (DMT) superfamily [Roseicitreum antarcticum]